MRVAHNRTPLRLCARLLSQLEAAEREVRIKAGRVWHDQETSYIPDVFVVPAQWGKASRDVPSGVEIDDVPLSLVVGFWSLSTGSYDVDGNIPADQRRGDLEMWRVHRSEQTLTAGCRHHAGDYRVDIVRGGHGSLVRLPGVVVDLDAPSHRFASPAPGTERPR